MLLSLIKWRLYNIQKSTFTKPKAIKQWVLSQKRASQSQISFDILINHLNFKVWLHLISNAWQRGICKNLFSTLFMNNSRGIIISTSPNLLPCRYIRPFNWVYSESDNGTIKLFKLIISISSLLSLGSNLYITIDFNDYE